MEESMYKIIRGYCPQFVLTIVFLFGVIGMFSVAPVVQADLLVGTDGPPGSGAVRRFNNFGTYLGDFTSGGPGLDGPAAVQFGPDGNLYVLTSSDKVFRYNGTTGVFIDEFIPNDENTDDAKDMIFGPDGNLYLVNGQGPGPFGDGGDVRRFNGTTGAFMDIFIRNGAGLAPTTNAHTVSEPMSIAFAPDGFVYLGNDPRAVLDPEDEDIEAYMVMRFTAHGQYVDTPFPPNFLGLHDPNGMTIGPDCNLYISSEGLSNNGNPPNPNVIYRLNLTTGNNTPDTIEEFVPSNGFLNADLPGGQPGPPNRGMIEPEKIVFGPNGDLYVTSGDTAEVWRFDGTTGAIVGGGAFAMQGLGADTSDPKGITFFPGESLQCDIPFPFAQVPTLNQWGLVAMAGALGIIAFLVLTIRRKKAVA